MPNTHGIADTLKETQAICYDLLPPCILSTSWPTVPVSSLTLAPFATVGYVRRGPDLVYVSQEARSVTVGSATGNYWIAVHADTHSAVSGWTRVPGSHYLWQQAATQPANPDGALVLSAVTVAGGVITSVNHTSVPQNPLSRQDGGAAVITGGTFQGASSTVTTGYATTLGVNAAPVADSQALLQYPKGTGVHGLKIQPNDNDTGSGTTILFLNAAGGVVGYIATSATATTYATSSDRRLKRNVQPLVGALDVLRQVRPVHFVWNLDDSYGEGFLADDLQPLLPFAVTGTPDAVNPDGSVAPMGIDYGKIVPMLTQAAKELLAQVEALTARVASLEEALGL